VADPDARLKLDGCDIEPADSLDHSESGADRPRGIILVRPRVAKINEDAVAHVFGDKPVEAPNDIGVRRRIGVCPRLDGCLGAKCGDRSKHLLAMSEQHAELFEVGLGQLRQDFEVDRIVAKGRLISLQTQAAQPSADVQRLPRFQQTGFRCHITAIREHGAQ